MQNSTRNRTTYKTRKVDFFLLFLISASIITLSYFDSQNPRFMYDGKSSGNVHVEYLFMSIFFILALFSTYKLLTPQKTTLTIDENGVIDMRLYSKLLPWTEIKKLETTKIGRYGNTLAIAMHIDKKYVTDVLGDKTKQSFALYSSSGDVILHIVSPNIYLNFNVATREIYDEMHKFWVQSRSSEAA